MKGVKFLKGEDHPCAKLKEKDIFEIRELTAYGFTASDIGRAYGIHPEYVGLIHRRQVWCHVR